MRRGKGRPLKGFAESSSSDEDDGFAAISKKSNKRPRASLLSAPDQVNDRKDRSGGENGAPVGNVASNTGSITNASTYGGGKGEKGDFKDDTEISSSAKRHHHINSARKSKMDALLQELQSTTPSESGGGDRGSYGGGGGGYDDDIYGSLNEGNSFHGYSNFPPPNKMGSYVEPGQEHLTTNIFVGNLDPMTTEEELTDAFRQFGDLYSVKIMWPRTHEERARNRNTGFVCFMTRADAQDAMDALQESDPLDTGRRMVLRWGKNVKKTVKFGTGGVPMGLRSLRKDRDKDTGKDGENGKEKDRGRDGGWRKDDSETGRDVDRIDKKSQEGDERRPSNETDGSKYEGEPIGERVSSIINQTPPSSNAETAKTGNEVSESKPSESSKVDASDAAPVPATPVYDPSLHAADAIIVKAPTDPRRLKFITTVASFVAKDGSILEQKLTQAQIGNLDFDFLLPRDNTIDKPTYDRPLNEDEKKRLEEHIFYRWRVYAFAQGDGVNSWLTTPFQMFNQGQFWIPPSLNVEAAQEEQEAQLRREEDILAAQEERRKLAKLAEEKGTDAYLTGRQLEHAKFSVAADKKKGGGVQLNDWEKEKFHELVRKKLCASQESICEAMAFAFDKSGAAKEISELLKEALLESANGISIDTRIARLYLLSDILFNSQQPGVRNAFHYRDAIESMAPEVFESLGQHKGAGGGRPGRLTMNKLRRAVSAVLSAWTNWSVYNSTFMDELERRFEGRPLGENEDKDEEKGVEKDDASENENLQDKDDQDESQINKKKEEVISTTPRGEWTSQEKIEAPAMPEEDQDIDGEALDDLDGEALSDVDGEVLSDVDGEALDCDLDGEALDDCD